MKLFCYGDDVPDRPCCSLDSINDARDVAHALGIPHYVLNLEDRFNLHVIQNFVSEYSRGRTPDPLRALQLVHQVPRPAGPRRRARLRLHRHRPLRRGAGRRRSTGARIRDKDQSYFLWGIDRAVVARMLTPVGELTKAETRAYARRLGLATADKPESVEICFVPDDDYVARAGAAPAGRRAGARARTAGHHDRRGDRRAPRLRAATRSGSGRVCPAASRSRATWSRSGPERREVVIGTRGGSGRAPRAAGGAQLAGRSARAGRRAARCRSATGPAPFRPPSLERRRRSLELALATPVRAITPGPVGRALRCRRPGARRRRDRLTGPPHALPPAALDAQRRRALGGGALHSRASISTATCGRLLLVAAVFGIVNSLLRPLLTILTCPLIVLTLGSSPW